MKTKENGVTELGFKLLGILVDAGAVNGETSLLSKEVAEKGFMMPKSVTGGLNALSNKELVLKTIDTPRKYIITPKGIDLLNEKK